MLINRKYDGSIAKFMFFFTIFNIFYLILFVNQLITPILFGMLFLFDLVLYLTVLLFTLFLWSLCKRVLLIFPLLLLLKYLLKIWTHNFISILGLMNLSHLYLGDLRSFIKYMYAYISLILIFTKFYMIIRFRF